MGGMCGLEAMAERIQNTAGYLKLSPTRAGLAGAHSKLFATCLVCGKQLSNQYNLRVHMETHQNVNYACRVCSHVSRSRDALRKHVSYRHPGEGGGTPRVATPKKGKVAEPATSLVQP
ncbi:hypothetical protein PR048_024661 [Dryococelus australis]|uniref:C2H2-type domain-containing protein n=1 Tax=Dryococelus australis TaxID=614101 RepID=A0ABQ9GP67_9NEOP|nr:hypothetical protein PR048_024661 [Dryococelus australis]